MHHPILRLTAAAVAAAALAACGNSGDPAPPPARVTATPGDGRIVLAWEPTPGHEYWIFGAADPAVTTDNWIDLPESLSVVRGTNPQPVCALTNGHEYWLTVNARTGTAAGGDGSPVISAVPRIAGDTWTTTTFDTPINGIGFGLLEYCRTVNANSRNENERPATGHFIALGDDASLYTSLDAVNWTRQVTPVAEGFTADLHAAAVFTQNPGAFDRLEQRWLAVGAESSTLRSDNGVHWIVATPPQPGTGTLRAIANDRTLFVAVGDGGRIRGTTDGAEWFDRDSRTTENLVSIVRDNGRFVVTGENGTLLISGDSNGWGRIDLGTDADLHGAAYGNNNANDDNNHDQEEIDTWVVVGERGTVARSRDNGNRWELISVAGAPNFVGVGYTTAFIALDDAGGVWRSLDGANWSGPVDSGLGPVGRVNGTSEFGIVTTLPGGRVAATF